MAANKSRRNPPVLFPYVSGYQTQVATKIKDADLNISLVALI